MKILGFVSVGLFVFLAIVFSVRGRVVEEYNMKRQQWKQISYLYDSRTNLCFAKLNWDGTKSNIDSGFINVSCTAQIRKMALIVK